MCITQITEPILNKILGPDPANLTAQYAQEKETFLKKHPTLHASVKGMEENCNEKCIPEAKKPIFPGRKYDKCVAECRQTALTNLA
uniref:Mitochondrial import inner membrane translocase subunit n=1 Tax=Trichuris muris TaxID=70415 RepID=A0A5S6R5M8_TRIMR